MLLNDGLKGLFRPVLNYGCSDFAAALEHSDHDGLQEGTPVLSGRVVGSGRLEFGFRSALVGIGRFLLLVGAFAPYKCGVWHAQNGVHQRVEAPECLRAFVALWQ